MILFIVNVLVNIFGTFLCTCAFLMLLQPDTARVLIAKFASTNKINYAEITLRLFLGITFIVSAKTSIYTWFTHVTGLFLIVTALILYGIPRVLHYKFSTACALYLKPLYLRFLSPLAFAGGIFFIYNSNFLNFDFLKCTL